MLPLSSLTSISTASTFYSNDHMTEHEIDPQENDYLINEHVVSDSTNANIMSFDCKENFFT